MKKTLLIFIASILLIDFIHAQYFSKIIDHDTFGQSQHYSVFPRQDYIYVIGDYLDSSRSNLIPFWSKFDYNGNRIGFDTLWDPLYDYRFIANNFFQFLNESDSICYFSQHRFVNDTGAYLSYILKLNIQTGKILKTNFFIDDTFGIVISLNYDSTKNTLLLGTFSYNEQNKIEILELNNELNLINRIIIKEIDSKRIAPYWIKRLSDSLYQIVGISHDLQNIYSSRMTLWIVDRDGKILSSKLLNSSVPLSRYILPDRIIHQRKDGDFVMAPDFYVGYKNNVKIDKLFSHPVRVSSNFDTIRWEIMMYNKAETEIPSPLQFYWELISTKHDSEYIVLGQGSSTYGTMILYKFSYIGDSLWYKRYIPGNAVKDSLGWVSGSQIAISPRGGLVVVGALYDDRYKRIRSYIMHLDDDGCLIPGCNEVVTTQDLKLGKAKPFKIFPNPFTDQLQILCRWHEAGPLHFQLIDLNGKTVWSSTHYCQSGDQLFWSLESVPAGNYILQITDRNNKILQSEKLIRI
ncbi:MAG: T9SS type A sorting domain-containing protein [Saprospiraceae bacterium]|nr:T9SS type A sorting domain-containing protein [Saprospiraceae bacterium]